MKKFKIGDRAKVVNATKQFSFLIGKECRVIGVAKSEYSDWEIEFDDGTPPPEGCKGWACMDEALEPITKLGSWNEIEVAVGWNPQKKTEDNPFY